MDITLHPTIVVKMTDKEWKLIIKALGHMAGIHEARPTKEDTAAATELNANLLRSRRRTLADQLKIAEGALERAESQLTLVNNTLTIVTSEKEETTND